MGIVESARALLARWRFGRFLVVGAGNTLFGYSVFAILFLLTRQHQLAIVVATIVGAVFNFFTTGRLVFKNRDAWAIVPFLTGYGVALGCNVLLLEGLVRLGVDALLAQAVSLPLVVITSYLINARLVFRRSLPADGTG